MFSRDTHGTEPVKDWLIKATDGSEFGKDLRMSIDRSDMHVLAPGSLNGHLRVEDCYLHSVCQKMSEGQIRSKYPCTYLYKAAWDVDVFSSCTASGDRFGMGLDAEAAPRSMSRVLQH